MSIDIILPKPTYNFYEGQIRKIIAIVAGTTKKSDSELTWHISSGRGKIDTYGHYTAPDLNDSAVSETEEIFVTLKKDASVNKKITITINPKQSADSASNPTILNAFIIGALLLAAIATCFSSILFGSIIGSATLALLAFSFVEITDPNIGFLFVRGKLRGQLEPGWYIIIPFVWDIDYKSTEKIRCAIPEDLQNMYTKDKTPIKVKAICFFHVVDLTKAIYISDDEIKEKVEALMASQTKTTVGEKSFVDLITHQSALENNILVQICDEIERNGYTATTLELTDFDEQVESEAAKIKKIGVAKADALGKKTKAVVSNTDTWKGALALFAEKAGEGVSQKINKSQKG